LNHFYGKLKGQSGKTKIVSRVANISQQIAQKTSQDSPEKTPTEIVPERYHKFLKVFNENAANRFPPS
jgi:hypothetical protein